MPTVPFKMPRIFLGQIVLWRHSPQSNDPAPAMVTRTGQSGVSVIIFPTDSKVGIVRDGVRHSTDPALATVQSDSGIWDYTEGDRQAIDVAQAARPAIK